MVGRQCATIPVSNPYAYLSFELVEKEKYDSQPLAFGVRTNRQRRVEVGVGNNSDVVEQELVSQPTSLHPQGNDVT